VFTPGEPPEAVAERGVRREGLDSTRTFRALRDIAERVLATRGDVRLSNLQRDRAEINDAGEIVALGYRTVFATAAVHRRTTVAVFVLLFDERKKLTPEVMQFSRTVANLVALSAERDGKGKVDVSREELEETSRMASLGLLTSMVGHELRAPAGALILQIEELRRLIEQVEVLGGPSDTALGGAVAELAELVQDMGAATSRIRETSEQLTTLSRRDVSPEELTLDSVVRESLAIARPHLERRGVVLSESFDTDCMTLGRRDNLGQVVLNLVFNAADAAQDRVEGQPTVTVRTTTENNQVLLIVNDNGPGIPEESIGAIFKPFYTTKTRGQGTGLGLKICRDVVIAHGGHIEVVNRPEGGASFRVVLPKITGSGVHPVATPVSRANSDELVSPKRVLVVDDDVLFTRTLRRSLRPHRVDVCASASEAALKLVDPTYKVDLVLCDVFLPGTNGTLLHGRVAEALPQNADCFVFVTGGALGKNEADYLKRSGRPTLFKPVDLKDILGLLDRDASPPSVRTLRERRPARGSEQPPSTRQR
jgi:signal transduction histidine kinase/CheY-like chemotaxis protein